jgi:hypothetical protein
MTSPARRPRSRMHPAYFALVMATGIVSIACAPRSGCPCPPSRSSRSTSRSTPRCGSLTLVRFVRHRDARGGRPAASRPLGRVLHDCRGHLRARLAVPPHRRSAPRCARRSGYPASRSGRCSPTRCSRSSREAEKPAAGRGHQRRLAGLRRRRAVGGVLGAQLAPGIAPSMGRGAHSSASRCGSAAGCSTSGSSRSSSTATRSSR